MDLLRLDGSDARLPHLHGKWGSGEAWGVILIVAFIDGVTSLSLGLPFYIWLYLIIVVPDYSLVVSTRLLLEVP